MGAIDAFGREKEVTNSDILFFVPKNITLRRVTYASNHFYFFYYGSFATWNWNIFRGTELPENR